MLVSEFALTWSNLYKNNIPMEYLYENQPTTLYQLLKINKQIKCVTFKVNQKEITLTDCDLRSDIYDLENLSWDHEKFLEDLYVHTPDCAYHPVLIMCIY